MNNLFKVLSAGGDPDVYPELREAYRKHKTIFEIFEISVDVRYGNFLHLPFSGGVIDQGAKTMSLLKYIQRLLRLKIADDQRRHNG